MKANGFSCLDCPYATDDFDEMSDHIEEEHPLNYGLDEDDDPWWIEP